MFCGALILSSIWRPSLQLRLRRRDCGNSVRAMFVTLRCEKQTPPELRALLRPEFYTTTHSRLSTIFVKPVKSTILSKCFTIQPGVLATCPEPRGRCRKFRQSRVLAASEKVPSPITSTALMPFQSVPDTGARHGAPPHLSCLFCTIHNIDILLCFFRNLRAAKCGEKSVSLHIFS